MDVSYGSSGGPEYSTVVVTTDSGAERRTARWSQPRHRYNATTGLQALGDDGAAAGLGQLLSFFHAVAGEAVAFRYKDWGDYSSSSDHYSPPDARDQLLGAGDGVKTAFQLSKTYIASAIEGVEDAEALLRRRVIRKPVPGTLVVALDGNEATSGWTCDHKTGLLTFYTAPDAGAVVTAGFEFDVPCRFEDKSLSVKLDDYLSGSVSVGIMEVRL